MQLLTLRSQRGKACCLALSSAPVLVRLLCIHDRSNEARKPQFIGTGEYELWIWLQQIPQYKISRYLMSYQQRGGNKRGILFSDTTLDLFISEAKASALRYFAGAVACASDAEIESLSPGSTARHHSVRYSRTTARFPHQALYRLQLEHETCALYLGRGS